MILDERYAVRVKRSGHNGAFDGEVTGWIQDKISLAIENTWEQISTQKLALSRETIAQAAGFSGFTMLNSRRIWRGTSPLKFTIKLRFMAEDNVRKDVIDQVRMLLRWASPSEDATGPLGSIGFLLPPGPSPLHNNMAWVKSLGLGSVYNSALSWTSRDERIDITVGKFLRFESVILQRVAPEFGARFDRDGQPVDAEVDVSFETYQIATREAIDTIMGEEKK
jgi:hypothetical protein